MNENKFVVDIRFFIIKVVVAALFLLISGSLGFAILSGIVEEDPLTMSDQTQAAKEHYIQGDYAKLYEDLHYLDIDETKKDIYAEITEAYNDYLRWEMWKECVDTGKVEGADEIEAECRQAVNENYVTCRNKENKEKLHAFVESMENR